MSLVKQNVIAPSLAKNISAFYDICNPKGSCLLLREGGVRRVTMWGQSLKSDSPEGQSSEVQSHRVQQSDLIQERQDSSAECSETSNLLVPDPVLKSACPRSSPQICQSQIPSSNLLVPDPVLKSACPRSSPQIPFNKNYNSCFPLIPF